MRIWSLHPKYLDAKGLVALWRETLLAQHVLAGKTKGYKNHPQLNRFKDSRSPLGYINRYLSAVWQEAANRGYHFDRKKIGRITSGARLLVTRGQMKYEQSHLMSKLKKRDPKRYRQSVKIKKFETHPLFRIVEGEIEKWEIVKTGSRKDAT